MNEQLARRIAVLARLIERSGSAGRTAVMKYAYFLTVLRRVPLRYDFTLYAYGPFDSTVLEDLEYAEGIGAVKSSSTAYGYSVQPGERVSAAKSVAAPFVAQHENDIDWVVQEFGTLSAADLELASTIVYVDRAFAGWRGADSSSEDALAREVQSIKPHFATDRILTRLRWLKSENLLKSVSN